MSSTTDSPPREINHNPVIVPETATEPEKQTAMVLTTLLTTRNEPISTALAKRWLKYEFGLNESTADTVIAEHCACVKYVETVFILGGNTHTAALARPLPETPPEPTR